MTKGRMRGGGLRLDRYLVDAGFFPTRAQAQAAIEAGSVYVDGVRADKAGALVPPGGRVEVRARPNPYVSRGGLKLERALDVFQIRVAGKVCLDIGASTGGFTDCLLQRGAAKVYAVDVGYGQLAWKLRQDPRVVVWERTNFRYVPAGTFQGVRLVTIDVSFISLLKILPALAGNTEPDADVVALVKPQFEAGRKLVGKGAGVIRDPQVHRDVLAETAAGALRLGWEPRGVTYSPITGPKGNIEFFLWCTATGKETVAQGGGEAERRAELERAIAAAVAEAHALLLEAPQ